MSSVADHGDSRTDPIDEPARRELRNAVAGWRSRATAAEAERDRLAADNARLRKILDHPDPHDFVKATEVEARFQMDLWGTEEGFPTAFDGQEDHHFAYLIGYLTGKVAASNEGLEKKLHRITTIGAAAANWHMVVEGRHAEQ